MEGGMTTNKVRVESRSGVKYDGLEMSAHMSSGILPSDKRFGRRTFLAFALHRIQRGCHPFSFLVMVCEGKNTRADIFAGLVR